MPARLASLWGDRHDRFDEVVLDGCRRWTWPLTTAYGDGRLDVESLLAQLLPTAIMAAIAPLPVTITVTLLMSRDGLAKAGSFATALTAAFAVVGVITSTLVPEGAGHSDKGSAVTGTIIAVLGVLFLLIAVKQWANAPDPDAPPPKFMEALDTMSALKAAGFGVLIGLINVKQVGIYAGGVAQIVHSGVSPGQRWLALAILLVLVQSAVIGVIVTYLAAPSWATRELVGFRGWLIDNNRVIGIVVGLVVGGWFTFKGVTQIVS